MWRAGTLADVSYVRGALLSRSPFGARLAAALSDTAESLR
jgi:hypothetical protein